MGQIHKTKSQNQETSSLDGIRSQLNKMKSENSVRVVTLKYKSCCGCGCDYSDIRRTVPMDSPLQNGDVTENWEDGDDYDDYV